MTDKHFLPFFAAIAGLALVIAPLGAAQAADTTQADKDKPVIIINGAVLTKQDVMTFARAISASRGKQMSQRDILNTLVDQELLYQDALAKKYDKLPEVIREMQYQRQSLLANVAANEALRAKPITDQELHKFYEERVLSQKLKEYKARHILVKTEGEAKDIIAQLDKGADFSKLAETKSIDTASAKKGGDLGWFATNQMVPQFSQAAAALTKGKYTETPVRSKFGWHVIILDDTRPITPPKFDDVKKQLQGLVQNEHLNEYLNELRKKAKIEQPK